MPPGPRRLRPRLGVVPAVPVALVLFPGVRGEPLDRRVGERRGFRDGQVVAEHDGGVEQPAHPPIDGVIYNVYVSIDDPADVPVPHGHPAPTDGSAAAAIVVERALLDLGFTHDRAAVDRGAVAEVGM